MSDFIKTPFSRRNFLENITRLTAMGSLAISPVAAFAVNKQTIAEPEHVFDAAPYLQLIHPTSISIRWITAKSCYSWVEFGETEALGNKAHSVSDGFVDANNRICEVVLEKLLPGKTYFYRVASKEITLFEPYKLVYGETIYSEIKTFQTIDPNGSELNWLVLNDIHDRPHSFAKLLSLVGNDPYDFVFLNGDMFDYQTDEPQLINHLLKPCSDSFASTKPFMFVRGNHETRGKFARQLKHYFTNPGDQYFSFQAGPVYAIALDTGEDKADNDPAYSGIVDFDSYRIKQAHWLEKELQSKACKKARYRVVMMHIPPFYSGNWHGTMHCRKLFAPLFDKYKIDLVISGHTHAYGVHPPIVGRHTYPIIIGGGPKEGNRTIIKVSANQQQLTVRMLRDDGLEVGNYSIT